MAHIYRIVHLSSGRCYVGHTARALSRRFSKHRRLLMEGRHHSPALQHAWDKYGADAFAFEVIEECSEEARLEREQWHIDHGDSAFNVAPVAGSALGTKHTEEHRSRRSIWMRGNTNGAGERSAEFHEKMRIVATRRKRPWAAENGRRGAAKNSATQKGRVPTWRIGVKHRPETIEKIRAAALARGARKRTEIPS